jgi:hypothetical protein
VTGRRVRQQLGARVRLCPAIRHRPAPLSARHYAQALYLRLSYSDSLEPTPAGECQRNIEMIWSTGQPAPHFKTSADLRKDHDKAIPEVCSLRYAASLICSVKRALPSMHQSSRLSMRGTRTSPRPR